MTAGAAATAATTGDGLLPAIMELRDEATLAAVRAHAADDDAARLPETGSGCIGPCLLYTSDAADE